jgi:hypothetical protein
LAELTSFLSKSVVDRFTIVEMCLLASYDEAKEVIIKEFMKEWDSLLKSPNSVKMTVILLCDGFNADYQY